MVIRIVNRFNYINELGSHLKKRQGSVLPFSLLKCVTPPQMGQSKRSLFNRTIHFLYTTMSFLMVLVSYWWVTQRVGVGGRTGSSLYFCVELYWYEYRVYQNFVVIQPSFIYSLPLNVLVLKTIWVV